MSDDALYPGSVVLITLANAVAGELTDIPLLYLYVVDPLGGQSTFDSTDGFIVRDSTGTYHANFPVPLTGAPGKWGYRWYGPGMVASEGTFYVSASILSGATTTSTPTPPPFALSLTDFDFIATSYGLDDQSQVDGAALAAVNAGGGIVRLRSGVIRAKLAAHSNVHYVGAGKGLTTVQAPDGYTGDMVYAPDANVALINASAAGSSGPANGIDNCGVLDLTIDGNGTAAYGIRFYGKQPRMRVEVINCLQDGYMVDWYGSLNGGMEGELDLEVHECGGVGISHYGPHDTHIYRMLSYHNGSHNIHFGPNAGGSQINGPFHPYRSPLGTTPPSLAFLCEANNISIVGGTAEGASTVQVAVFGNQFSWQGGNIFNDPGTPASAFRIGQAAGGTPYARSVNQSSGVATAVLCGGANIKVISTNCLGSNGVFWLDNDAGGNEFDYPAYITAGKAFSGTRHRLTYLNVIGKGSGPGVTASVLALPGAFAPGNSASSASVATNGTINTSGVYWCRVTPSGDVTGVIVEAGSVQGVEGRAICVVNQSTHSITFAADATSHLLDGAGVTIPSHGKLYLVWLDGIWR